MLFRSLFYRPTVLSGAGPGTPAYDNEVFGPVAPIIRFATPGEAADLASDGEYGLDLSIMTADIGTGLEMGPAHPHRYRAHQRPDRLRRCERAIRRDAPLRQLSTLRRRADEHRGMHGHTLDHRAFDRARLTRSPPGAASRRARRGRRELAFRKALGLAAEARHKERVDPCCRGISTAASGSTCELL